MIPSLVRTTVNHQLFNYSNQFAFALGKKGESAKVKDARLLTHPQKCAFTSVSVLG